LHLVLALKPEQDDANYWDDDIGPEDRARVAGSKLCSVIIE
jgi:hypothetical protein